MANILAFLSIVFVFILVANAASVNDTECLEMVKTFGKCMGKSVDKNKDDKMKKFGQKIQKCFDDNKCAEPDFEGDPFANSTGPMKSLALVLHDSWEKTPDNVKKCLKHGFRLFLMKKLNQCLKKQKVDEIKLDDDEVQNVFEHALKHHNFTDEEKKGHKDKKEIKAFFNTVISLKRCGKEHGRDAANGTLQCIGGVKEEARTDICKVVNSCKKDSFSDACKKRGKDIQKALCKCQFDKLKEVKKRLNKLQDGKSHKPEEFKGVMGDDFEEDKNETLAGIKACYEDNKAEPPQSLELVLFGILVSGHHEHKGPEVLLPLIAFATAQGEDGGDKVSADEIWFTNELVGSLIAHHECGCD